MNIERADYGTIVTFGTLEDLNTKLEIKVTEIKVTEINIAIKVTVIHSLLKY